MESIVPYAIWLVIILVGAGLALLVLFGIRSLTYGKVSPMSIVIILIPFVIFLVLGLVMPDWVVAAIWTLIITIGLVAFALVATSFRSVIGR